jgi:hypothetical protein
MRALLGFQKYWGNWEGTCTWLQIKYFSWEYSDSVLLKSLSNNISVIAGINATMEKMLSERGKILVIFENFKFRNCGSTEKGVVYNFNLSDG